MQSEHERGIQESILTDQAFPIAGRRAAALAGSALTPSLLPRLPYNEFFGGVSGLTVEQFQKINGFPNAFWGWGGEDDDLWNRYELGSTQPASLKSTSDGGSARQALHVLRGDALAPLQPALGSLCPFHLGWGRASPAAVARWEQGLLQPAQAGGWRQTEKHWLGNYLLCVQYPTLLSSN